MQGRVLVVSADPARRRTFRDNLFLAGHTAFDAPNRSAALEACEDFGPSVAVIDLAGSARRAERRAAEGKPAKTSVNCELVRQIVSAHPSIRILAICDTEHGPSPQSAVAAGAHDYVREPVCIGELLVRVDKHLGVSTKIKKLRRVSPRPRRKIILRYMATDSSLELAQSLAPQLSEEKGSLEAPGVASEGISQRNCDPASVSGPSQHFFSGAGGNNQSNASPESSFELARTAETHPSFESESPSEVTARPSRSEPRRLSDLVSSDHAAEGTTMAWISLQGLDKAVNLGLAAYEVVSESLDPTITRSFPNAAKWWAGSEAVAVLAEHIASPLEVAIELKSAIDERLEALGLSDQIALRVSATTRRWGEGRAIFLARATGRISNGSLPISRFEAGSRPHPEVTLPAEAAKVRSGFAGAQNQSALTSSSAQDL